MTMERAFGGGLAAILAASGAGTVLATVYVGAFALFLLPVLLIVAFLLATAHYVALGLPLSLLVSAYGKVRWWNSGLAGLMIGGLPVPLLMVFQAPDLDAIALASMLPGVAMFDLAGLAGGLAFRAAYGGDPEEAEA